MMVYYGWVAEGIPTDPLYRVLRNALMRMPEDHPLRGPREYAEDEFLYVNSWDGDLEGFSGEEQITQTGKLTYKASYLGGLIDVRGGI